MKKNKTIRVGVVGVGRGSGFAAGAGPQVGMELVAICDTWEERLNQVGSQLGVATYGDFDKFLSHDMDAVILANYFHQHAPFAVKALQAGFHVMSETSACKTLAEGVALVRAVEKSGKTYMFAENYPYMAFNQEMRRRFQAGDIGDFQYGEGEYVHPMPAQFLNAISPGKDHWRNWIPATYYSTHALAPLMFITGTRPVTVNGFVIALDDNDAEMRKSVRRADPASVIICRMDNGAVVKLLQVWLRGEGVWVRVHGNLGLMENLRTGKTSMLRVVKERWEKGDGEPHETIYQPDFPQHHAEASKATHGGGDFFMNLEFATAIRTGKPPILDVHAGVTMSIVGPQAYRSALEDGAPFEIPDFRKEADRRRYAKDDWSPDPADRRAGQPWPSVRGNLKPAPEGVAYAREVWDSIGYTGR